MLPAALPVAIVFAQSPSAKPAIHLRLIDGQNGRTLLHARVSLLTSQNFEWGHVAATPDGDGYAVELVGNGLIGLGNIANSDTAWNQYEECAAKPKETSLYSIEIINPRVSSDRMLVIAMFALYLTQARWLFL